MEFIWDEGNITKSSHKHGIFPLQAMSVFKDKNAIIFPDEKHSVDEQRYNIVGRDIQGNRIKNRTRAKELLEK